MTQIIDIEAVTIADKGLAVDLNNAEPMTEQEAQSILGQIRAGSLFIRAKLLEIHRRKGWMALGYESWREFAEIEFNRDGDSLYIMVEAAEVEANLIAAGIEAPKILGAYNSHLKIIRQIDGIDLQVEAFNQLETWKQEGEVTAKDAEAAVWSVDTNKRYNKAEKLVSDYISSNRDAEVSSAQPILEWAQEKKGLSSRQAEILKEDVTEFVSSRPAPVSPVAPTSVRPTSTPQKIDKSLEAASSLNAYEPEEVAQALTTKMDKNYAVSVLIGTLPKVEIEDVVKYFQDAKTEQTDIRAVSDKLYSLCVLLDETFGL